MATVSEAMTRNPITIDPDAPLGAAVAGMCERGVRHLLVTHDGGRLVGIVTDRDLQSTTIGPAMTEWLGPGWRRCAEALGRRADNVRVRDVMTWDCVTTDGAASVEQPAARMLDGKIGCLPVLLDGRLVGILTERDILSALRERLPAIRGDADDYFP